VVVDFAARDKADFLRALAARAARVLKLSSDAVADKSKGAMSSALRVLETVCRSRMRDCAN
jgi:hypothetical protein